MLDYLLEEDYEEKKEIWCPCCFREGFLNEWGDIECRQCTRYSDGGVAWHDDCEVAYGN